MKNYKFFVVAAFLLLTGRYAAASVELPPKYKNIVERNLFNEDMPSSTPGAEQDSGKGFEPKEMQLYGLVSIGKNSQAFFKPSGQLADRQKNNLDKRGYLSLKVGDKLEGYTFKKLDERFAVFENATGNRLYVTLYDTQNAKKEYVNAPIGQATPKVVSESPPAPPTPSAVAGGSPQASPSAPAMSQELPVNHPQPKTDPVSKKQSATTAAQEDAYQDKLKKAAQQAAAKEKVFGGPNAAASSSGGTSLPSGPNPFLELLKKHR